VSGERLGRNVAASDAALGQEARRRFPSTPRDVADLVARAEGWATTVVATFARSGAQALASERAERALTAAQRIRARVDEMEAEASDEVVAQGVEALRFAETIRLVERARDVAVTTAVELSEALTVGDPYVVGAAQLAKLAADPFDARRRALDDRVGALAVAVRDQAYARWKAGDVDGALAILGEFVEAAGKETSHGAAYPQLALDARQLRDEITSATQEARNAARDGLATLAADVVAALSEAELEAALRDLADEPRAAAVAAAIVAARARAPLLTTTDLARAVLAAHGLTLDAWKARQRREPDAPHPAARAFQALRILVNDELGGLDRLLAALPWCLRPGGRAGVLSFHSGEDRRVKHAFRAGLDAGHYDAVADEVVRASPREVASNPRAAPAKLRWARRAR